MKIKTRFARAIEQIDHTWISMSDGARLSARIWVPDDADRRPVPAILEYIPYRKDDRTAEGDAMMHPYFAGHGYASVRVDMRGSGDSEGILLDEYLPQEQEDGLEILSWIAGQPWCSGQVGMVGISWGGFNALQIAARRPPELKALVSVCSTDDRYADDCHYMGGCLLSSEMLFWASYTLAFNARPPDPQVVGEGWRQVWMDRLQLTPPYIEQWLTHQRRDAYWKHGSVCEDYSAITCPVYLVSGWADAYTNAIPRLLEGLTVPRKGMIGPWAHMYPHIGAPGPAIGFLQECLRWWDHWLKGMDSGIMEEPMLRAWMLEGMEPSVHYSTLPGRWVAEDSWPPPNVTSRSYCLNDGTMDDQTGEDVVLYHRNEGVVGLDGGAWCPFGAPGDFPPDQRRDDGASLSFTSKPVETPMEILGFPQVTLSVAADKPIAMLAVRLCDIWPNGASARVTWGLLNLTHRESHEEPTPLKPGERYVVTIPLNAIAYRLLPGHRWRLSVSAVYWPHAWPSPEPVTLTVLAGASSRLDLPVRASNPADAQLAALADPECAPPLNVEVVRRGSISRNLRHELATGLFELSVRRDYGQRHFPNGINYEEFACDTYSILQGDPLSAAVRCDRSVAISRNDWQTRVETTSMMSGDATSFRVSNVLDAYEGNARVFLKTWHLSVPRDHL